MLKANKSIALLLAALIVTVGLMSACSPAQPAQQITLRIGTFPSQNSLPFYAIQELGLDKKSGITYTEISYQSGAKIITDIADGVLDLSPTVSTQAVISAAAEGRIPSAVTVVAGGTFCNAEHPSVAVLANNSVSRWTDLKGKQIGVNGVKSMNATAADGRMKIEGVGDYTLVEMPVANAGLAVSGGNIAAAVMSEPYLTQSLLRGDGKLLGWIMGGPPFENMQFTMLLVSTELCRKSPEMVKTYLRSHLEAVKWMNGNQGEARKLLAKKLNLSQNIAEKMILPYCPIEQRNDPALIDDLQSIMITMGLLKAKLPTGTIYDERLLNEVLAEKL